MNRAILATIFLVLLPSTIQAGTISVQVRDSKGAPLAEAVVYAIPEGRTVAPSQATAVMDQKDRMFIPYVLAIQTGTSVRFPNSDDIQHHVYSFSRPKPFQLPLYKGTPANPVLFDKPGVVVLGCNIHDRMSAFIFIVDTSYFAKTGPSGRVELKGLSPGSYSVAVWYPEMRKEPKRIRLTVSAGERHEVAFSAAD